MFVVEVLEASANPPDITSAAFLAMHVELLSRLDPNIPVAIAMMMLKLTIVALAEKAQVTKQIARLALYFNNDARRTANNSNKPADKNHTNIDFS